MFGKEKRVGNLKCVLKLVSDLGATCRLKSEQETNTRHQLKNEHPTYFEEIGFQNVVFSRISIRISKIFSKFLIFVYVKDTMRDSLPIAIAAAFALFLFLFVCFYTCLGLKWFSSFIVAYLIAFIVLFVIYPIQNITGEENEIALTVYTFLSFFLVLVLIVYVLYYSLTDCREGCVGSPWFKLCRNKVCDTK